jgi:hypothetical protein
MKEHLYTQFRPYWCKHPPFESIDYCWGLALAADKGALLEFYKDSCDTCDLSKFFNRAKFNRMMERSNVQRKP